MGKLERKLDISLVARIKKRDDGSLYIPRAEPKPIAKMKPPRASSDYRGSRRNATRATGAIMVRRGGHIIKSSLYRTPRLNRSDKWPRAKSYVMAREVAIKRLAKVQHEIVV
jgi:hypothetical protein